MSATSTQTTDVNKALSVFNNSNTNNFSVSYKGRVDAEEYYGTFKGTIDPSVPIENAAKIQIHHNSTNSFFNVPFFASGLADDSYQDVQYDNSDSLQFNPSTGRVRINSGDGLDALTIRTNANATSRGLAFQNSGNAYTGYVGMVNAGGDSADMVFGVDNTNETDINNVIERMRIATDGNVGINSTDPQYGLDVRVDSGIRIRTVTNGGAGSTGGAVIRFTDQASGSQQGHIIYKHPDNAIAPGSNDGFLIGGTETLSVIRVEGRAVIDEKVGIGSDDPQTVLDVQTTTQGDVARFRASNNTRYLKISSFNAEFDGSGYDLDATSAGGALSFSITGNEKLRITKDGDVGIGTTNPDIAVTSDNTSKLSVGIVTAYELYGILKGSIDPGVPIENANKINITNDTSDSGTHYIHFGSATSGYDGVEVDSTGLVYKDGLFGVGTNNPNTQLTVVNPNVLGNTVGISTQKILKLQGAVGNNGILEFKNKRINSNGSDWTTSTFRIQRVIDVTEMGYIDFGTGGSGSGSDIQFGKTISSANDMVYMHLDNTGNVGIGSAIPTEALEVRGNIYARGATSSDKARIKFGYTNGVIQSGKTEGNVGSDYLAISADGGTTDHLVVKFGGNVGIGTDNPKSVLEVAGSAAVLTITDTRDQSFSAGDVLSSLAFDTDDASGGAGSASHPRAKINLVTENTFGSATGLSFATKADTGNAPEEKLRISSAGLVTIKNFNGTGLQLQGSGGDYQGLQLQTTDSSASQTRNIFIDAVNETGAAVANQVGSIQSDGGSAWIWQTQPTGNRTDRRVERLRIDSSGNLLRGGTGQNIGASNARWATGYFTTIDATNLTGTISAPGSNTQVLFNNNGNVGADAGLTFDSGTDKLTVGGDIKLGGTGNGGTLFFDEAGGGVEKIKQSAGSLELYADGAIKFFESDNDTLMVTFDINTTYNDARIILENDTDTYFNHPDSNQLGFTVGGNDTLRLKGGQIGISTSTLQGKLDIDTGTGQNSATEYYGQDFGLVIKHQSGSGANDEGNGICFVQKWYDQSGDLVRTGAILGYKQSSNGSFGGGLIFKTQQNGASPLGEVLRLTQEGNVGINKASPREKLDVTAGRIILDQGYQLTWANGTTNRARIHGDSGSNFIVETGSSNSEKFRITSGGQTIVKGEDDQDNFKVDVASTEFAVHTDASDGEISLRAQDGSGSNNSKYMTFYTHPSGSAAAERLRITSNGSVNIGGDFTQTTDKLQVTGNGKINGDLTVTGTVNATVTGTTENATNINVAADNTGNATHYPIFVGGATGNQRPNSDTGLTYNPNSGNLSARNFFAIADGGNNTNSQQIVAGDSSGSVALTVNDGYGNCNLAFNHRNGVPDSNGSSGRIWCAVDSTTADMSIELANSAVSGQARSMTDILRLTTTQIKPFVNIIPSADGTIDLGTNGTRFGHGYFDNVTAANISGTISVTGSNKQVLFNSAGNVGAATTLTIEQSAINVGGSINLTSELNFTGSNNKYIDVETLASSNSFNIRHHNPTGNLFENAFVSTANAETKLYYNGSNIFETTQRGIKLTSNLASNGGMANMLELNNTGNNTGDGSTISFSRAGTIRAELQVIKNETSNNETDMVFKTTKSGGTVVENMRILGSSEAVLIGNSLTAVNSQSLGTLIVDGGSNNIGGIQIHAGGGETAGDLSGICFSHGNTGTSARPKAAIALRASGAYGKGDLCFYVDNTSDNNAVSSADEVMRINSTNGTVNIGGDYTQTTDRLQVTGSTKINGDLTVTGTVTYDDVTDIVSVGIVTATGFRATGATFKNTTGTEADPTNVALMIENNDFIYTHDSTSSKRRLIGKSKSSNPTIEVIEIGQTGTALIDEIRMEPGNAGFFSVVTGGATGLPASGERIRVSAGGSFAVATNDPKEQIHLKDGAILVENVDYAANQDAPYLIAGSQNHASGGNTNTNWGTSGMQHRIKVNSGGVPRLTIDVKGIEYFSFNNGGYLGIDAPDPTAKLQIGGVTGDALRVGETEFKVHQSASNWNNLTYASNPILAWDFKSGPGDLMYMASGGNTATTSQMALVISDAHGFKVGRSGYDGTDYDVDSSNEYLRLTTSGTLNIGGSYTQTSKKLYVNGDAEVTGTLTAGNLAFNGTSTGNFTIDGELSISDYIRHTGDTNTHIRFPADDTIRFTTSNAEAVEITPDRSIRIGEESPIVLDATNEEAIYIRADIRSADADAVYGIRMDIDDDNTGTTTGDRERGSMYLHFDGNNAGGDTSNETRIYNIWNDINVTQDYDLVRGIYNDIAISSSSGTLASLNGVYTDIRVNNAASINLIAGHFAYARKSGANASGSITQMYGQYVIARNDAGATGSVTTMYGTRSEVRVSDGATGNNANTNVAVSNAYAVYARMENDNHANGQTTSGTTALYYGTYATTNGLNNPYGLYIHSSAPNNYIGGNLEVNGNLTVNGTISDGAVTDVAVSYTGRSAPCTLPITITGTTTKTINIPTNSNAFGAKYVQTSEPTGTSICDGDVWYDTTTESGSGGITISNATEATYRNITFADGSSSTTLKVNDNGRLQVRPSDGAVRVAGDITAFYSSDARLKKNVSPIKNALEKVNSISGNTFEWNEKTHNKGKEVGVIAQEVEKLQLPGVTTTRQDGTKAVRYEKLIPLLIEAIKELKGEIDELKRTK